MFVRPLELRTEALALIAQGVNDCEISRRLGVPRTTVRDWRKPRYVPRRPSNSACPRCGRRSRRIELSPADYAELLALYLGDGHIVRLARSQRLRIFLDARYRRVVDETEALMQRCFPANPVRRVLFHDGAEVVLDVYSSHLICLFPQYGPGKKHERPIVLRDWQAALVQQAPWAFLRAASAPTAARSSIAPAATSTSATTSPTTRPTSWTCSSRPAARSGCVRAETRAAFGSIGARTWPGWSSTWESRHERRSLRLVRQRLWRNWHTRGVQVAVGATPWRFESSQPHSFATLSEPFPPLSSRGLGRRPLTAETGVRIPVAVLDRPR